MKIVYFLIVALFVSACGQGKSEAQIGQSEALTASTQTDTQTVAPSPELLLPKHGHQIECLGVKEQGGSVICQTSPGSVVKIGGIATKADELGRVILGFDRDAPNEEIVESTSIEGETIRLSIKIAPRTYTISRIDGLPPSQVSNYSKAQLVRIRSSSARKKKGFSSREQTMWFKDGFAYPLKEFIKTSPFGAQRILNGVPKSPHYGVDIAAPVGTPIYAPADGVVSLADDDLYFEGAMVLLDHGQGLISMYLHMNAIDVAPGQVVKRGEKIGEVGAKGRATGPHLCWRLKWRNRHLDPELLTQWPTHEHAND